MEKYDPLMDSTKLNDSSKIESAKRFLANITWVYENVQERGTKPADGRHNRITIKRFAPGAPNSCVREVLDILTQQAPYQDPVISNTVFPGKWKPKLSWFRKDSRYETVNNRTASVTLIQELIPADEDGDSEIIDGGGNCTTEIVYKYVWDATEVELPEEAKNPPQGVQYSVNSVSRDDDTGLFSYYITKHVAIEQKDGPYISDIRNSAVTWTTTWKNAYEIPEGLPEDGETVADGEVRRVTRSQNDDCTWDITLEVTKTLEHDALEACEKTFTEHKHTSQTGGNKEPISEAPAAGGGKHYSYSSKKEEDGTYTHSKAVTTEIARKQYTVAKDASLYGTRITTVDKNQANANVSSVDLDIGESIRVDRTSGGSYDVTRTCVTVTFPGEVQQASCKTVSETINSRTVIEEKKGNEKATAGGGVLVKHDYEMTEYGTWRHSKTTTEETPVESYVVTKDRGIEGLTTTVVSINGQGVEADPTRIGSSVKKEKTPGGLTNVTTQSTEVIDVTASETQSVDAFTSTQKVVEIAAAKKDTTLTHEQGVIKSVESQLTNKGAYQNTTTTQTDKTVGRATYVVAKTAFGTTTTETTRNARGMDTDAAVGVTVKNTMNQSGTYDVERTVTNRDPVDWSYASQETAFSKACTTKGRGASKVPDAGLGGSSNGEMGDDGKFDYTLTTVTPKAQTWESSYTTAGDGSSEVEYEQKNGEAMSSDGAGVGQIVTTRNSMNEFGLMDSSREVRSAGDAWKYSVSLPHNGGGSTFVFFGNQPTPVIPSYSGSVASASASVSKDMYGLYNGHVVITFRSNKGGGGGGDDPSEPDDSTSTSIGRADVKDWSKSGGVTTKTVEIYNGVAYDVTWKATMRTGYKADPNSITLGGLNMPGGPSGGVFPFSVGAHYTFFDNVERVSVVMAGSELDGNGAPVVGSSSPEGDSGPGGGSDGGSGGTTS